MKPYALMLVIATLLAGHLQPQVIVEAQAPQIPPGNVLVYDHDSEETAEYVRLSADYKQVYTLPLDKCSSISPDGTYVAQSSPDGGDLVILRLDTQDTIIQTPWEAEWDICHLGWWNDTHVSIGKVNQPEQPFRYEISGSELIPFQPPPHPEYPALPGWMEGTNNNYILSSPNPDVFLYERCNNQETDPSGKWCNGVTDFVVYDVNQQAPIEVLIAPNEDLIRGYDNNVFASQSPVAYGSAVWSHTGRYLAYQSLQENPYDYFDLSIYDLNTDQYLNTEWVNATIDPYRALQWSPQGDKLAFWIEGRLGEVQPEDNDITLRTLVFYDANTETFSFSDQPFNLRPLDIERAGLWSLDGQGYAFKDLDDSLFYVDADTGTTTLLDTSIKRVIAWQTEETFTALATVSARQTNLWGEANTNRAPLDTLPGGQFVTILGSEPDGEALDGNSLWYRVRSASNKEGYVWSGALEVPQPVTRTAITLYNANLREVATSNSRITAVVQAGETVTIQAQVNRGQSVNGNRLRYQVVTESGETGFIWSGALSDITETHAED